MKKEYSDILNVAKIKQAPAPLELCKINKDIVDFYFYTLCILAEERIAYA